jgi:hypothetical protein
MNHLCRFCRQKTGWTDEQHERIGLGDGLKGRLETNRCDPDATLQGFLNQRHTSGRIDLYAVARTYRIGELDHDHGRLAPLSINDVRTLVAKQLSVDIEFVTSELTLSLSQVS